MRKKLSRHLLKRIRGVLLAVTVFATAMLPAAAATAEDFTNIFDVYYSSDMRTVTPTSEALSGHWELDDDGTLLVRNTADSNWASYGPNMALLYLKKTYENFELTTTFSRPKGDGLQTYFGIGAQKAQAWSEDTNSYVFGFHQSGGLMWGKTGGWITGGGQTPADKISGYATEGVHTLRLRVLDKVYTAWVDGIQVGTGTLTNYSAGYIWFGADDRTAKWGIPEIKELVSTSVLSAYHTGNAKANETMTATALTKHWTVKDDMVERNDQELCWDNSYQNLSVVYLNTRKYKSFEMTVPYRVYQGSNHNNSTLIGFGATEMGRSFYFDDNAVACNISKYGAICSADTSAASYWYKGSGSTLHDTVTGWNDLAEHTLTVRVVDGTVLYSIDGHTVFGQTLRSYTEAGYIFFASNELTTRFGVPSVRELSDTDTSGNAASPLYRQKALFVGDSISYGAGDDIFGLSWGGRIGIRYGMDWLNRSVSGSTVMETAGIPQIKNQLPDGAFDYVVLEGGINDALKSHPLGAVSDSFDPEGFDTATFGGAFEELLYTARQKYPQAKLGYIVTMRVPALADDTAQRYYALAQEICEKWDVACLNLFGDEEVTGWFADGAHLPDKLHPDADGYQLLTPKIAAWMEQLAVTVLGDCNGDGTVNADDQTLLRQALLGLETATWRYNANRDGQIDIRDLVSQAQTL